MVDNQVNQLFLEIESSLSRIHEPRNRIQEGIEFCLEKTEDFSPRNFMEKNPLFFKEVFTNLEKELMAQLWFIQTQLQILIPAFEEIKLNQKKVEDHINFMREKLQDGRKN